MNLNYQSTMNILNLNWRQLIRSYAARGFIFFVQELRHLKINQAPAILHFHQEKQHRRRSWSRERTPRDCWVPGWRGDFHVMLAKWRIVCETIWYVMVIMDALMKKYAWKKEKVKVLSCCRVFTNSSFELKYVLWWQFRRDSKNEVKNLFL